MEKSKAVSRATGPAENRMYGRSFPQRVCVMSMRLPTTGSRIASRIFATVMMTVTTTMPSDEMCAYCSRYSSMKVDTVVRMMFCPKPAATTETLCLRSGISGAAVAGVSEFGLVIGSPTAGS
jgi:hypothetical protein